MNELIKLILSLSISGSLLILLLFALRPFYRERFSKRWQYYIWLVVLLRFILPFAPATNLMGILFSKIESSVTQVNMSAPVDTRDAGEVLEEHAERYADAPSVQANVPAAENPVISAEIAKAPAASEILFPLSTSFWLIWLVISLILMVHKITVYRSFIYYVRSGNSEVSDPDILNLLSDLCEQTGVKARVELSVNPLISSPLLMGFFQPHIVLSGIASDKEELRYILLHELTHYKNRDMFYKWLTQVVVCLHWFNPLVYKAAREINKACELACDEMLILNLDVDDRKAYGSTLLAALDMPGKYKQSIAATALSENAAHLKERLESIMKFQGKSKWGALAAVCALLLIVAGTMTGVYASASSLPAPSNEALETQIPSGVSKPHTVSEKVAINVTETISESINETVVLKPNITGGSVALGSDLKIKSLDIKASIGNLTVKRGEQYRIEVGSKLTAHAIYDIDYDNGILQYFDDYKDNDLQINNTNEGYDITITVPNGSAYDNVKIQTGFGTVSVDGIEATAATIGSTLGSGKVSKVKAGTLDVRFVTGAASIKNCTVSGAMSYQGELGSLTLDTIQAKSLEVTVQAGGIDIINSTITEAVTCNDHFGGLTLDGLKAASLTINGQNGGLTMRQCAISNGMDISLTSGGAEISGDIKGNISIEKGIGGFNLTLTGSKRNDYHIVANRVNSGISTSLQTGITIDGKSYSYDYDDASTDAPYTMKISDSNIAGNNVSIRFNGQ